MSAIQIRPVVASDLPHLMGIDHSVASEYVWQLELRRETGHVIAAFRDARLPRPITLTYPNDPFSLADEWSHKALMLAAIAGGDAIGYICLNERPSSVAWVPELVVAPPCRRQVVARTLLIFQPDLVLVGRHPCSVLE